MSTVSLTLADLAKDDTGTFTEGKFEGREFTVLAKGTQGRLVLVQFADTNGKGSVFSSTAVRVTR